MQDNDFKRLTAHHNALERAQSAIRNPPNARQGRNPPQSAIRHAQNAKSLRALEPGTAQAQERPQN
eukprot:1494246-Alexandrium_andersonii.AAC.1